MEVTGRDTQIVSPGPGPEPGPEVRQAAGGGLVKTGRGTRVSVSATGVGSHRTTSRTVGTSSETKLSAKSDTTTRIEDLSGFKEPFWRCGETGC